MVSEIVTRNFASKLNYILLKEENKNPFPPPPNRTDFFKNRPNFICGREKQITKIRNLIEKSIHNPEPALIEILGKQGIGKSTLICWIYNVMKEEGLLTKAPMVFLNTMGNPEDFKGISFYKQVIRSYLESDLLETIVYQSIQYFIKRMQTLGGRCKDSLYGRIAYDDVQKIITDLEFLKQKKENDSDFLFKTIELFKQNFMFLQSEFRINPNFIVTLWSSFNQTTAFSAQNALSANGSFQGFEIRTEADAFQALNNLITLNLWMNKNQGTMIIIFDHLEASVNNQKKDNFNTLFSLLLRLRQFNNIVIVLSGTLDAFDTMEDVLEEDQKLQLENWAYDLSLRALKEDVVVDIVSKYLDEFWSDKLYKPPEGAKLYPFGINSVKYLYNAQEKDLRKTLRFLYDKMEYFRSQKNITVINTFFDAIKEYRKRNDIILTSFEQDYFVEQILGRDFQDKERSTKVEIALYNLFQILHEDPEYMYISDVKHEPPIGPKKERPDIFLEFFGRDINEDIKKLAIEVKIYTKTSEVGKKDIEKTHILLTSKKVDYIWWFTNVPLSINKYSLPKEFENHLGRTTELSRTELAYTAFIVFFKRIFRRDPTPSEAYNLLIKTGLDIEKIKKRIKSLSALAYEPQKRITAPSQEAEDILDLIKSGITSPKHETINPYPYVPQTNNQQIIDTAFSKVIPNPGSAETSPSLGVINSSSSSTPSHNKSVEKKKIHLTKTPREIVELNDDSLEAYIEKIIQNKSNQRSMRKSSIITELEKNYKISVLSAEDKNRVAAISGNIAEKLGFRTTAASIMFQ